MVVFAQAKVKNITWRLHERRGLLQENMELRNKMLAASYHMQLRNDRNSVASLCRDPVVKPLQAQNVVMLGLC